MVGGSHVPQTDIQANNGIIHTVDSVLLAPNNCMLNRDCAEGEICGEAGVCRPAPAPGTCANPFVIEAFDWYEGDTSDRVSNEFAGCVGPDDAPDHVYRLSALGPFEPFPGLPCPVCLTTLGTNFDTVVHVREGDCDGREVICGNETVLEGNDGPEVYDQAQVTLFVELGREYRIIVDGFDGAAGPYTLGVINGACAE